MNAPPPDDDRSERIAELERAREALDRLTAAHENGERRPYLETPIPDRKLRQLKAAVIDAETIIRQVRQSSMEALDDLMELSRQLNRPDVTYQDIYIELSDIVRTLSRALTSFRQQHYLDAREGGRSVITARLPLNSSAQQDAEEDASSG